MAYEAEGYSDAPALIGGGNYLNAAKQAGVPSLKLRLDRAVKDAESALAEAKRAREILDAHPELEELLNIMQRGRF